MKVMKGLTVAPQTSVWTQTKDICGGVITATLQIKINDDNFHDEMFPP
jgi:hypothetical protein